MGASRNGSREGRPVTTDVETPASATFTPREAATTASADEVAEAAAAARRCSSTRARRSAFAAKPSRSIRSRAIFPGARNRPWASNLNADGTFKSAEALRGEFAKLLGDAPLGRRRALLRQRRQRLPQPARDGSRRAPRHAALPRLVERMVRAAPGAERRLAIAAEGGAWRRVARDPSASAAAVICVRPSVGCNVRQRPRRDVRIARTALRGR